MNSRVHTVPMPEPATSAPRVSESTCGIGEAAALTGLTPDTLRCYEQEGLLASPPRTHGGFRRYRTRDLERLRFIRRAQAVGLALEEIRELGGLDQGGSARCRRVRDLIREKLAQTDQRLSELRAFRKSLAVSLRQCDGALEDPGQPACPVVDRGTPRSRPARRALIARTRSRS